MSVKEKVMSALDTLPENATFDEVIYHLYVHRKIEIGLDQAERGELISDEELARQFDQWDAAENAANGSYPIIYQYDGRNGRYLPWFMAQECWI